MSAIAQFQTKAEGSADPLLLSAALESCRESLAIIESGRIVYANRAFAQIFGYLHPSGVQGKAWSEFVSEDRLCTQVNAKDADENAMSACGYPECEFNVARKDGTHTRFHATCAEFQVNDRRLLIISTRDITLRKQAEQQLREAQRMEAVGRLVGGVAHDFNNLLTGIMLYCDLLTSGLRHDRRLRHHAEEIRMACEHGSALVQQLLAVARQQVVEPQVLSWNEIVSGARNLLARLIGEDIELNILLADDLGFVKMDPAQVQQIVFNLVLNARDAMPNGGRITLETRNCTHLLPDLTDQKPRPTPCIEFSVTDTGYGMDAETCSHLFEPFFTTKRPGQGNGLGLMNVYSSVKQAGGTITVESAPGRGTSVIVRLPQLKEKLQSLQIPSSAPAEKNKR
jgi:two-component system cell cycle sensor histidine kinase/response regulator CckA